MTAPLSIAKFALIALASVILAGQAAPPAPVTPVLQAADKTILTVSGKISPANIGGVVNFDRASLEALGMVAMETTTPWHKGVVKFEGIPLHKLMQSVGATGERLTVIALNDYSSELPIEDFAKYNVLLALKRDGEYMPVRDKGPLFIIYPYDALPELRSQKFYGRSVWQVARLIVK
jgi:hypothetical protein